MPHEITLTPCAHCGEAMVKGSSYCPTCGAPQPRAAERSSGGGGLSVINIVVAVVLVLVAAPFGLLGGTCTVLGLTNLNSTGAGTEVGPISLMIGLPILAVGVGLCILAAWLLKRGLTGSR